MPTTPPAESPAPLEEITLKDGTKAWIRPVVAADREMHRRSYLRLSQESRFHRFLSPRPELTEELLHQLVDDVDGVDHIAYYVFLEGSDMPAAVGRIIRDPEHPDCAEMAITVHDEYQRRGIGRALNTFLVRHRPRGVTRLQAVVTLDNLPVLQMMSHLGTLQIETGQGTYELRTNLLGTDTEPLEDMPTIEPPTVWGTHPRVRSGSD